MELAADLVGYLNNALFLLLAIVCLWKRRHAGGRPATFAALAFSVLAFIAVTSFLTPDDPAGAGWELFQKVTVGVLLLFPYFLYRFATSFEQRRKSFDLFAAGVTAALIVWVFFLPPLPGEGDPQPAVFRVFVFFLLGQWTSVSVAAALRLWIAGRNQPGVVKRRMSLLASATVAMNVALLLAGLASQGPPAVTLVTQLLALASSVMFILGILPPAALKVAWRRREEEAFRDAIRDVVSSADVGGMARTLLPHVAAIVGARRVALLDDEGQAVAEFSAFEGGDEMRAAAQDMTLFVPGGRLVVTASPYTPFFGGDEVRLVEFLGTLMNLAYERARLSKLQTLILNAAGEGIYGIDPDGKLIFINPSGAEMFGWPAEDLIGSDMHSATHHSRPDGEAYPRSECPIFTSLADGRTQRRDDEVFWRRDGSSFPVEYISTPIREGDSIAGVVVTFTDISERRLAEEASALAFEREREARLVVEKTNEEMESFVYTVSHDLNSPLVSVAGYLNFFRQDFGEALGDQARFFLDRIAASTDYMQALIRDLLEFSRVGRAETEPENVDLSELVPQIVDEVRTARPGLQVTVEGLPAVSMNGSRARQLFANLLQNAARYAGPEPLVQIRVVDTIDGRACVSVRDNGPGIAPEHRDRAFEVFQRLQQRQSTDGTGIGLAICKRIVENAGGEIWIADSSEGADFRMTLPMVSPLEARNQRV